MIWVVLRFHYCRSFGIRTNHGSIKANNGCDRVVIMEPASANIPSRSGNLPSQANPHVLRTSFVSVLVKHYTDFWPQGWF